MVSLASKVRQSRTCIGLEKKIFAYIMSSKPNPPTPWLLESIPL